MSAIATQLGLRRPVTREQVLGALLLLLTIAWSIAAVGAASGDFARLAETGDRLAIVGPIPIGIALLLWRPHSPFLVKLAFGYALSVTLAVETVVHVRDNRMIALVPLVLLTATALTLRFRTATLAVGLILAGMANTLEVFTPLQAGPIADLALGAGWLALIWLWITGRAPMPRHLPIAAVPLIVYVGVSLVHAAVMDPVEQGLYAWRVSCWLMSSALLVAMFTDGPEQRARLHRVLLAMIAIAMGYAMVRWVIGPADKEAAVARRAGAYVTQADTGELRLFGGTHGPHSLGPLAAVLGPFALASALSPMPAVWRVVAAVGAGSAAGALIGADARTAMVAGAIGFALVVLLYAIGRGFVGRRALPIGLALLIGVGGGGYWVSTKLGENTSSGARFRNILHPLSDYSVQDRLVKWSTILDEVDGKPFGNGMGASGIAATKYARFETAASYNPDSSYVKVAFDQGFAVMALFVGGVLVLIVGLTLRAVRATDAVGAAAAAGAAGGITAFAICMALLVCHEGIVAIAPWLLAGFGLAATGDDPLNA